MEGLHISDNFTIDDIHKIREYNYESTKNMTLTDRRKYYKKGADEAQAQIDAIRNAKKSTRSN